MKIQDITSTKPTTVTPDTPITEAARMMKDHVTCIDAMACVACRP